MCLIIVSISLVYNIWFYVSEFVIGYFDWEICDKI